MFQSPPPRNSAEEGQRRDKQIQRYQLLSPTDESLSNICLNCRSNAQKHFCSTLCQTAWYNKWSSNTPYPRSSRSNKRIIDYQTYLAKECWNDAVNTSNGSSAGNLLSTSRSTSSSASSSTSSSASISTGNSAIRNCKIYVVPLFKYLYDDKGHPTYSKRQVNTEAWKAFGVPWIDYLRKIVLPVALPQDQERLKKLEKKPPETLSDLSVASRTRTIQYRLHFLLFNIIYNVTSLGISFPRHINIVNTKGKYAILRAGSRQRLKGSLNVEKTKAIEQKRRQRIKQERKEKGTELLNSTARKKRLKVAENRKRKRQFQTQEAQVMAKELEIASDYEELKNRMRQRFRAKKTYIKQHSKHWSPVHENLNAVGGGMPGSVNNAGSFELCWLIKEVCIPNEVQEEFSNFIEEGQRTLDQARNNKMFFPKAAHFGYEYENFLNFSMYDQEKTDLSLMELDALCSIYDKREICTQPYGFAYNVGYSEASANYTYPEFLVRPCLDRNCNRFTGLGDRTNPNRHRCSTCGFNREGNIFSSQNRTNICTWFSKSWDPKEKELKLQRMGRVSSNISIFFMGDELKNHTEGHDESTLRYLNAGTLNEDNKWVIYEKGFVCQLVGGGTTFHGAIYIRQKLLKAKGWIDNKKRRKIEVMKAVIDYYKKEEETEDSTFVTSPAFTDSSLLRILMRCRTSAVEKVSRAIKNCMVNKGAWKGNVDYPDPGSMALWVQETVQKNKCDPIDVIRTCLEEHFCSYRESYRGLSKRGVVTTSLIEEVVSDMQILLDFADERNIIYDEELFCCNTCELEGTKELLFGHVLNARNTGCAVTDIWFKSKGTMQEVIDSFNERITDLNAQILSLSAAVESSSTQPNDAIANPNDAIDEPLLSEEETTHIIVKQVIDIFEKKFSSLSEEQQNREYLYRKKANITNAQVKEYLRWNRVCKNYRSYANYTEFYIMGKQYRVNHFNHNKSNDKATRTRLIEAMYSMDFPEMESIRFDKNVDCVVVDSVEKAIRTRLQVVLRNKIRRKRFQNLNRTLLIGINYDGAPFNKTGMLTSQTVLLGHILNEGMKATMNALMLFGVISADETSEEAKTMVRNIDEKLAAFATYVANNPITIEGQTFTEVEYVLCSDLKATNKVTGVGSHSSEFFGVTHIGISQDSCGYGVNGRGSSEQILFKDFRKVSISSSSSSHSEIPSSSSPSEIPSWKRGDNPIPITSSQRKKLFEENKRQMRSRANLLTGNEKMKKRYRKAALGFAKDKGHSFVYEPFFKKTQFVTATFCALHYKSVKVLDFLDLSCQAFMNYDRLHGITGDIGNSLDCFLDTLENDPFFKSQLSTYAIDARTFWEKAKIKKGLCHSGDGLKQLNSLLAKDKVKASRLLGRQANIPLKNLDKFKKIFNECRRKSRENHKETTARIVRGKKVSSRGTWTARTKEDVEKDFDHVIAGLLSLLLAIRNMVFYMGASGLNIFGKYDEETNKPIDVSPSDFTNHIGDLAKKLKNAALEIELLQTNLFPSYNRAYDVCVTFCLPYVTSILEKIGILHGQAGLLECFESFHKYYSNLAAYKSPVETANRESRNQYKFTTIWLIFGYLPLQPYSLMVKTRKRKEGKVSDIIPPTSNYGSSESCYCGTCKSVSNCTFCNAGGTACTVKTIYDLINKTKKYLQPDIYLTPTEKTMRKFTAAFDKAKGKRQIFKLWQAMRARQFIKGLRCKPVV